MSYTWVDGEVITAEKLNGMKDDVFEINVIADNKIDKTYESIVEAIKENKRVCLNFSDTGGPTSGIVYSLPLLGYHKIRNNNEETPTGEMFDNSSIYFGTAIFDSSQGAAKISGITLKSDGTITRETIQQ